LRDALRLVEDPAPPPWIPEGLDRCLAFERTGKLAEHWQAGIGSTAFGQLGSLEFWLGAPRQPGMGWWLPSHQQWLDRCAQVQAERQQQRARAALG
jgi:hypothetical protein